MHEVPRLTASVAILGLVIVEVTALFNGINGQLLTLVVAAISGLGGYSIRGFISGGGTGASTNRRSSSED